MLCWFPLYYPRCGRILPPGKKVHISFRFRGMGHALFFSHDYIMKNHNLLYKWAGDINEGTNACRIITLVGVEHKIMSVSHSIVEILTNPDMFFRDFLY